MITEMIGLKASGKIGTVACPSLNVMHLLIRQANGHAFLCKVGTYSWPHGCRYPERPNWRDRAIRQKKFWSASQNLFDLRIHGPVYGLWRPASVGRSLPVMSLV